MSIPWWSKATSAFPATRSSSRPGSSSSSRSITAASSGPSQSLFDTGHFDDVQVEQRGGDEKLIIAIIVKERPILQRWTVRGTEQVSEGAVRGKFVLIEGRPSTGPRWGGPAPRSTRCTRRRATTPRR